MFRKVGAIIGNHYRSVLIRNISESGALIEGLTDVPVGRLLLIDFGEGQLVFARVRRARKHQQGLEFEQPLVSDGNGGLCTSHRVSPYLLSKAGLPSPNGGGGSPATAGAGGDDASALETLRHKLGLSFSAPKALDLARDGGSIGSGDGNGLSAAGRTPDAAGRATPTIRELADQYLAQVRGDKLRHDVDTQVVHDDILPRFGALRPDELAPSQIAEWLAIKVKEEGYPPAKVSRLQGILGQMYVLAMQWGMAGGEPSAVPGISVFGRSAHERCLTTEEVDRLNRAAQASPNPQLKVIVSLLMSTGTRQRELLEARWADIDLEKGIWRIPTTGPGGVRTVTLSRAALETIRDLPRYDECSRLIVNPTTRKPFRSISNSWETARRKAGLPDVEIDDLRHSAANDRTGAGEGFDPVNTVLRRGRR